MLEEPKDQELCETVLGSCWDANPGFLAWKYHGTMLINLTPPWINSILSKWSDSEPASTLESSKMNTKVSNELYLIATYLFLPLSRLFDSLHLLWRISHLIDHLMVQSISTVTELYPIVYSFTTVLKFAVVTDILKSISSNCRP